MRLFVKQNTFVNCVYVHTQMCVCVCVRRRVLPLCLFPQTTHCICSLVSVCYTHPAFPAPSPSLFVKTPGIMWMCVRMCVCVFAFYFAHCSVTTECFPPRLPPLPHCNPLGDIKGKPEKGYLEKRVAKQPNTHHPGAPPTQNSVPGLQPD